jgi:alpha-beta hydrolase superfamily lysophospholipase
MAAGHVMGSGAVFKRWLRRILFAFAFLLLGLVLGGAVNAKLSLPDLKLWHRVRLDDVTAATLDRNFTFQDYAAREEQLFAAVRALETRIDPNDRTSVNRYHGGSRSNPQRAEKDWNRSYETEPSTTLRGGALLLHGLTDSPYSMRAMAGVLRDAGFYSLALRVPGHGTVPSGLVTAEWEDWVAAARVGVRHVRSRIPADAPLILVGYSNGGAIALKYTFETLLGEDGPMPSKVILLSPMIGVTPAARLARWIGMLGMVPYFEKAYWIDVVPEYNPFKYNSFPANAGFQTSRITRALDADLGRIGAAGLGDRLPPILTFLSIVDSTVSARAVVTSLYERLPANGSALVLFDVNHLAGVDEFIQPADLETGQRFIDASPRRYQRVLITNTSRDARDVEARVIDAGVGAVNHLPLGMAWPADVFSLTHIALPFRPDDPLYGYEPGPSSPMVNLGRLSPRGEKGVLTVATDALMRLGANPFFEVVAARTAAFVNR